MKMTMMMKMMKMQKMQKNKMKKKRMKTMRKKRKMMKMIDILNSGMNLAKTSNSVLSKTLQTEASSQNFCVSTPLTTQKA